MTRGPSSRDSVADCIDEFIGLGYGRIVMPTTFVPIIARVLASGRRFFAEVTSAKMSSRTGIGEGYRAYASEYTDVPSQVDLVESFSMSVANRDVCDELSVASARELAATLLDAQVYLSNLAEELSRSVLAAVGHPVHGIARLGFLEWSRMQQNYGQPRRASREAIHVPHEDGNLLTILYSTSPGLEAMMADGSVRDLWSGTNDLLFIAGEIFTWVTNGTVATGFHRVRRDCNVRERLSTIFFGDPNPAVSRQWAPWVSEHELHDRITAGWVRSGVPAVHPHRNSLGEDDH